MTETAQEVAQALLDTDAFLVRREAPFRLTSGFHVPFCINCRLISSRLASAPSGCGAGGHRAAAGS